MNGTSSFPFSFALSTSLFKLTLIRSVSIAVSFAVVDSCLRSSFMSNKISFVQVVCICSSIQSFIFGFLSCFDSLAALISSSVLISSWCMPPSANALVNFFSRSNSLIYWEWTSIMYCSRFLIELDMLLSCAAKRLPKSILITSIDSFILFSFFCKSVSSLRMTALITSACMLSYSSFSRSASCFASSSGVAWFAAWPFLSSSVMPILSAKAGSFKISS